MSGEFSVKAVCSALGAIGLCVITGCIYLPAGKEPPYTNEKISFVELGVSTREDVEERFGAPTVSRKRGQIVVYGDQHIKGYFVEFGGDMRSGTDVEPYCCVVQYDASGVVTDFASINEDGVCERNPRCVNGCTETGVCVRALFDKRVDKEKQLVGAIVLASPAEDAVAKSFPVDEQRCSIYLYQTGDPTRDVGYEVALGVMREDKPTVFIDNRTYLHWYAAPGLVAIRARPLFHKKIDPLQLECEARKVYFLNAHNDKTWNNKNRFAWSTDAAAAGQQFVAERRLVLE